MHTDRTMLSVLGTACLVVLAVLTTGDGRGLSAAHAGDAPPAPPLETPPASATKARPRSAKPEPPMPACLEERYRILVTKVPSLVAKHGAGTTALAEAYAIEKDALVGREALIAAGCLPTVGK